MDLTISINIHPWALVGSLVIILMIIAIGLACRDKAP